MHNDEADSASTITPGSDGLYTRRTISEAANRVGCDVDELLDVLDDVAPETPVQRPIDGTPDPVRADDDGVIEIPYERREGERRSARIEQFTSRERQSILLLGLEPQELVEVYLPSP